ncbi:MAG: YaaR family protein [Clostridiales bacterium]|jgi:uncharacterized protein YaaR (DUF327 family)|nr:YaaR family protein [Clostridiales bacterium]
MTEIKVTDLNKTQQAAQKTAVREPPAEDFRFALRRLNDTNLSERLNSLMNEIAAQGEKIAKHMDIRDMRAYRALIGDFVNEIVTNSYKFSRENYINRRGRHMVYSLVRVINQDLDDLAQELLKTEKDNIAILDKTGEITGLLMDLLI